MPSSIKPHRPEAWLTKAEMANVLDVRPCYFDREVRQHVSEEHVRRDGRRLLFYARGVLDNWYQAHLKPAPEFDELALDLLLTPYRLTDSDPHLTYE